MIGGIVEELAARRELRRKIEGIAKRQVVSEPGIEWVLGDSQICSICLGNNRLRAWDGGWRDCWCVSKTRDMVDSFYEEKQWLR